MDAISAFSLHAQGYGMILPHWMMTGQRMVAPKATADSRGNEGLEKERLWRPLPLRDSEPFSREDEALNSRKRAQAEMAWARVFAKHERDQSDTCPTGLPRVGG
jgi:hypothetical protein